MLGAPYQPAVKGSAHPTTTTTTVTTTTTTKKSGGLFGSLGSAINSIAKDAEKALKDAARVRLTESNLLPDLLFNRKWITSSRT